MKRAVVDYIAISRLRREASLQGRTQLDLGVIEEYAERMRSGALFPPVLVFSDAEAYWLVDGYHRTAARERLGHASVLAEIRSGTRADALWESCSVNQTHGLRRSNADKRLCVERALQAERARRLSDRQIAHHCGVHHDTVGRIRRHLVLDGAITHCSWRNVVRAGSHYLQRVERAPATSATAGGTQKRRSGAATVPYDRPLAATHALPSAHDAAQPQPPPAHVAALCPRLPDVSGLHMDHLRRLSDAGILGIVVCDLEGNITRANDCFLRMVDYSREELALGRLRWRDLTPTEWTALDFEAVQKLQTHGIAEPWEKEYLRKDGSRVRILVGVAMLDAVECVAFVLDITARVPAAAVSRAQHRFS